MEITQDFIYTIVTVICGTVIFCKMLNNDN